MNFFQALKKGIEGVLQGKILRVATVKTKNGDRVKIEVGIPELFIKFDQMVPERLIPDCIEGREVRLVPNLKLGEWSKCELDFQIKEIVDSEEFS